MPAPLITPAPPAPLRSQSPSTFTALAEAFVDWMAGAPAEFNALAQYLEGLEEGSLDPNLQAIADLVLTPFGLSLITIPDAATARAAFGAAPAFLAIEGVTDTAYALDLQDAGKHLRFTAATAVALTIPLNATAALPIGTRVRITQAGEGLITLVPETAGVTLNSRGDAFKSAGSKAIFEVEKVATDEWDCLGDLTA